MYNMDDPGCCWPAWKFGMKRNDLFTKLHDQYNTFTFNLQDPEAFHHDVCEISRDADTVAEFHRLLADRQRQRIKELHQSLESLAVEIIANPKLMDSEHWQYALQLFRTKSFDSIVRYFASYLPNHYFDRYDNASTISTTSSFSDTHSVQSASTTTSSVDDAPILFPSENVMTKEPLTIHTNIPSSRNIDGPLSPPRSEAPTPADTEPSSPVDSASSTFCSHPSSRSMSFSESEMKRFSSSKLYRPCTRDDDDEASQADSECAGSSISFDCGASIVSDTAESQSSLDTCDEKEVRDLDYEEEEEELPCAQFPEDAFDMFDMAGCDGMAEYDTPTPRQGTAAPDYIDYKYVASQRISASLCRRSLSPKPHQTYRSESSPIKERRSPDESSSKIQKSLSIPRRNRPKDRRRVD